MIHNKLMMGALLLLAAAGTASAAELNTLSNLKVQHRGTSTSVVLTGSRAPTFTVFRLSDPDRLVVDLASADASGVKGHHDGQGLVSGVVANQFSDERATVARVLLALNPGVASYDVHAEGKNIVIALEGTSKASAPVAQPAVKSAAPAVAQREAPNGVVRSKVDEKPVKNPAGKLTSISYRADHLRVIADGELAKYELLELADPPRLALDVFGVTLATKVAHTRGGLLKDLRAAPHADKVRIVLELAGQMPEYKISRTTRGVELSLRAQPTESVKVAKAQPAAEEAEIEIDGQTVSLSGNETAPLPLAPAPQVAAAKLPTVDVKALEFRESPNGGRVEIKLSGEARFSVDRPDPRSAVLTLDAAKLPKSLERSLDTSALETPVKMVSAFAVPGDKVRIVIAADGALEENLSKTANGLSWRLNVKGVKTEAVAVQQKAAGFSSEAPTYAEQGAPRANYSGRRVSFEFKDIDIHNLLRVIAEVSKKNIVVADDVTGKVTIRLRNVPWDQALELILRSKGLGKEELGNIIRVAPLATLESEAKLRAERRKALEVQEELVVQLIPVNYAKAEEMSFRVKEVLSARGNVTVDTRTNVLIVRDIASNIGRARSLVTNLDTQTPQVLIESRIVEANTSFSRQIGVQWGGEAQMATGTGNPTGISFPYNARVAGGSTATSNAGTADVPNFAVNLPAAVGTGSGGALGFIFGSAGGAVALNLRLSALENQGAVKTISAPKVTTLDNNAAKISQGVSIPFSQVSAQGVNTTFVEARLSLEVTPHITQDGSILMMIKAENNQPDPSSTGANGQPSIQRKEANTQVLVKDGDTTVIGGIYVRRSATSESMVPFFGRIPILGFFFKNNTESEVRQELLIFITPRIINRQTIAQSL